MKRKLAKIFKQTNTDTGEPSREVIRVIRQILVNPQEPEMSREEKRAIENLLNTSK